LKHLEKRKDQKVENFSKRKCAGQRRSGGEGRGSLYQSGALGGTLAKFSGLARKQTL